MNLFVHWINEHGEKELVTPPLSRGDILPGVTRDSLLTLCREWGEFKVAERDVKMSEIVAAVDDNRMIEIFGSGTAAVLSPVKEINYNGQALQIPLALGQAGELCQRLWDAVADIQYGKVDHPWSVKVE